MKFSKETLYKGRNGLGTCVGVEVECGQQSVRFYPENSRGHLGSCWFEVPKEDVPAFCAEIPGNLHELILSRLPKEALLLLIGIHPVLDAEVEKRLKRR